MPPTWLQAAASIYVPLAIANALLVLVDIFVLGRRQHMAIMDAVWPLTMLYWGPLALLFYAWFGRAPANVEHGAMKHGEVPMWQATFKGATHCGAGCALGDFTGDWIAFATAFALFGSAFAGSLVLSFALAYLLGVVFQYFSVVPMRHLGFREGVWQAVKIDTLSLLAYEVGMFVVMGGREWLYPELRPTSWTYWLLMQVAMIVGFLTTYPVNWWLIRSGIKEKM
ncbi:MAG: DUF4396 domain-containing protein [Alphaproteobacteria bacterium]|nr:MAG: DUF4396 domain-containing protein [Alphaproteobacteria bacterium]